MKMESHLKIDPSFLAFFCSSHIRYRVNGIGSLNSRKLGTKKTNAFSRNILDMSEMPHIDVR